VVSASLLMRGLATRSARTAAAVCSATLCERAENRPRARVGLDRQSDPVSEPEQRHGIGTSSRSSHAPSRQTEPSARRYRGRRPKSRRPRPVVGNRDTGQRGHNSAGRTTDEWSRIAAPVFWVRRPPLMREGPRSGGLLFRQENRLRRFRLRQTGCCPVRNFRSRGAFLKAASAPLRRTKARAWTREI